MSPARAQYKETTHEDQDTYRGPDRRAVQVNNYLSDDQLEEIAERAAQKAIAKVTQDLYTSIGRAVLTKVVWSIGVAWVALIIWLNAKGFIKF